MIEVVPIHEAQRRGFFDARYQELGRCEIAVLEGETALAGGVWDETPVMIHLAGRFARRRVGRLIHAFVRVMARRGYPVTVTALDTRLPQTGVLRRVCQRAGGQPYATTPPFEWLLFRAEEA